MCLKYREIAFEKPSTDCFDFIVSSTIVRDDLRPIFKILAAEFEFYGRNYMKNRTSQFIEFYAFQTLKRNISRTVFPMKFIF